MSTTIEEKSDEYFEKVNFGGGFLGNIIITVKKAWEEGYIAGSNKSHDVLKDEYMRGYNDGFNTGKATGLRLVKTNITKLEDKTKSYE